MHAHFLNPHSLSHKKYFDYVCIFHARREGERERESGDRWWLEMSCGLLPVGDVERSFGILDKGYSAFLVPTIPVPFKQPL